jgi:hypothetical protein
MGINAVKQPSALKGRDFSLLGSFKIILFQCLIEKRYAFESKTIAREGTIEMPVSNR